MGRGLWSLSPLVSCWAVAFVDSSLRPHQSKDRAKSERLVCEPLMLAWIRRWRARRTCFHGFPAPGINSPYGQSYVRSLMIVDWRKLYECNETEGGCGKRWVC